MMRHRLRFLVVLCLTSAMVGFLPARPASGTEIRVRADVQNRRANPELFGNSVILGGDVMGFNEWVSSQEEYEVARDTWNSYLPYLSEMGPTVLRYPGGLTANDFLWKEGIGPFTERNPHYGGIGIPQTFGTDEFLQYCEELGAEPILVANVSVATLRPGTVQDAADWVEYCNAPNDGTNPGGGTDWAALRAANGHKEPYGVKYWELGNEDTYPGFESYANRVRAYSEAMRAIDPGIQVGVISSGSGLDSIHLQEEWLQYRSFMLDRVGDCFDFWSQHLHIPSSSGNVNGFNLLRAGAAVETGFSVGQAGKYRFEVPAEGRCYNLQCPELSLKVDGQGVARWQVPSYGLLRSGNVNLEAGEHTLRLEAGPLVNGARITVRQQMNLFPAGQEEPLWVDLKKSEAWYHAMLGAWPLTEEVYRIGEPYTGGKPVYYTEANTAYQENKAPPFFSKACYLREMLNTGCVYHFFLRQGVPLANYWLLFHDRAGIGALEGVAFDQEAWERGRPDPHRRPVFHLLKAYRWNVFDRLVSSEVLGSPRFLVGPQTGITIAHAFRDYEIAYLQSVATITDEGDRVSLFVINLHPGQDLQAPVYLEGFQRKTAVKVLTITGPSPSASNEPEDCPSGDCVTTEERTLPLTANPFLYRFPRHSVTIFVFFRTGTDQQAPAAPLGLKRAAGDGRVLLQWEANGESDLRGYNLYRSRCQDGPYRNKVNAAPIEMPEYLDPAVDNGTTYTYAATAVDLTGNESGLSNVVMVMPLEGVGDPGIGEEGGQVCKAEGPFAEATCEDGLDNDCDGFPDGADCDCSYTGCAGAQAAHFGSGSLEGSGLFNELLLFLVPVAVVVILRRTRRRG